MGRAGAWKKSNFQNDGNRTFVDIKVVLFFFRMIGLAPINSVRNNCPGPISNTRTCQTSVSVKFVLSRFGLIYNAFLIVTDTVMSIICIQRLFISEYPLKTSLTMTIDLTQAGFGVILMNALWIFTSIRRRHMVRLLDRLVKVDATVCRLSNSQEIGTCRFQVIGVFIVLMIIWIVLIVSDVRAYGTTILDWFNDVVPGFIITQFVLQYAFMVKMFEMRYRSLNNAIVNLSTSSITKTFRSFVIHDEISLMNCDYFPKIIDFRHAHKTLYDIGSDVAEFYSLPILLVISLSCFEIVYNSYFGLMPLTLTSDIDPTFIVTNSVAWVLVLIVPIALLAKGVDSVTAEMRKTTDAIYKVLDGCNLSREDKAEFEQFSIELLHRKIEFSAYGLFPLDSSLVHSIFSSTITYLVILLQFQISTAKPDTTERPELAKEI